MMKGVGKIATKTLEVANSLDNAADAGKVVKYTKNNFRKNLSKLTGKNPTDAQAHHIFPQKFETIFNKAGIDINDPQFGAWVETKAHQHSSYEYNAKWEAFLKDEPGKEQIIDKAKELAKEYGYKLNINE